MKKLLILICIFTLSLIPYTFSLAAEVDTASYVIGPGDTLEIHAWNKENPDILIVNPAITAQTQTVVTTSPIDTHSVTVSRDGRIYVPLVGVVKVDGMTTKELEDIIKNGLRSFTPDAKVTVLIKSAKPVRVYLIGEVQRPGLYGVPDGVPEECRLINFINLAGGLTPFAQQDQITVKRKKESFVVDLYKAEKDRDIGQNIILKDEDTVVIPQKFNQIYVLGYVLKPGPVRYIDGASISDYIGNAGGFTRFAAMDNIGVIRGDPANPTVIKVQGNPLLAWNNNNSQNIRIFPGDIIYVPQSWFADWNDMTAILVGFRDSRNAVRDLVSSPQWDTNVDRNYTTP
jgi:polysaccharide export outer membrane protein